MPSEKARIKRSVLHRARQKIFRWIRHLGQQVSIKVFYFLRLIILMTFAKKKMF